MGLLDGLMNDPGTMGLLGGGAAMMNASGPSLMPHSLGQVLAQGLQGGLQGYRDQYKQGQTEQMNKLDLLTKQLALSQGTAKLGYINRLANPGMGDGMGNGSGSGSGQMPAANMGGEVFVKAAADAGLPDGQDSYNQIVRLVNQGMSPQQAAMSIKSDGSANGQPAISAPQAGKFPLGSGLTGMAAPQASDDQSSVALFSPGTNQNAAPNRGRADLNAMIGLALMDGKLDTAYNIQKDMQTGYARDAGKYYIDPATGKQTYMIDPTKGIGIGPDGNTRLDPNFAGITGQIAGATADATEAAKARYTSQTITGPNGRPTMMSGDQIYKMLHPDGQAPQQAGASPAQSSGSQGDYPDLSSLPPAHQQFLAKLNPQAYAATANRFAAQQSQAAPRQAQQAMPYGTPSNFGGGIPLQSPAEAKDAMDQVAIKNAPELAAANKTAEGAAAAGQVYQTELHKKVEGSRDLVRRNAMIEPLLDKFTTGGIAADQRLDLGNAIQNLSWVPDGLKNSAATIIANGDPRAGKLIQNQLAAAGVSNMLQVLDKEATPNRAIFNAIHEAQESIKTGNGTLKDIFKIQKMVYDNQFGEQQALTKSVKDGSYDPRTWQGDYSAILDKGIGNSPKFSATSSPANSQPASPAAPKVATLSDIAVTAKKMGISTAEATKQLKAAGFSIGGN